MSREGGQTSQKHGGAHPDTHGSQENVNIAIQNDFPISNTLFPANQVIDQDKRIQNGGEEAVSKNVAEENLSFLSSDVDLNSYEREVVENNAEWLKSRCRNIETVDFDIANGPGVEELFSDPLSDDSVIPLCGDELHEGEVDLVGASVFFDDKTATGTLSKSIENVINFSDAVQQTPLQESNLLPISVQPQSVPVATSLGNVTIKPHTAIKSIPSVSLLKNSNLNQMKAKISNAAVGASADVKNKTDTTVAQQVETSKTNEMVVQVLPQVLVTGNTVAPSSGQNIQVQDAQNVANLKLATISISTDKAANSTQILVNTSQGQQLYHINTADLNQAHPLWNLWPVSRTLRSDRSGLVVTQRPWECKQV